jgi:hypothetical protein
MYLTRNRRRILASINEKEQQEQQEEKEPVLEEIKEDNIYCLICWEPEEKQINPITKMQTIYLFNYTCECDCNFHPNCFLEWATKTHTCPICREPLTVNMEIYYQLTLGNHYKFKLFCKKIGGYIWSVVYFPIKYLSLMWIAYVSFWVLYGIIHVIFSLGYKKY